MKKNLRINLSKHIQLNKGKQINGDNHPDLGKHDKYINTNSPLDLITLSEKYQ